MVQAQPAWNPKAGGNSYMVAVDGSDASELAFSIAMKALFRPEQDNFNVCTITNNSKDYLPWNMRGDYIAEKYQAKIWANAQSGNARFVSKEKDQEKTTKETLWQMAKEYNVDVMVTGMHGRKGPKADLTVAGSAVQYLAQQPITVAIMKDTNMHIVKDKYRWGVLFDGSAIAVKVLEKTLGMIGSNSQLTIITVVEATLDGSAIKPKIEAVCGERQYESVILENMPSCTIKDRIKMYLREQAEDDSYIDFVCVGNRGLNVGNAADGENYLGTVANAMIAMKKLNVVFIP